MPRPLIALACLALALAGCGGDDQPKLPPKPSPAAAAADLGAIKAYLLEHTERLVRSTEQIERDAQAYYDLAKASRFDYADLLRRHRGEVAASVKALQADYVQSNPDYEQ